MEIYDNERFSIEFIEKYTKRGFGSMTKNDFEILIFYLLKKYGNLKDKRSNHEISLSLQIPESKVKRLLYEADLKYGNYQEIDIKNKFYEIVSKSKLRAENKKIQLIVEDQFLKTSITAKLKELGHFSDSSFNAEIITIHIDSFVDLLEAYYPTASRQAIVEECKKAVKSDSKEEVTFKGIIEKIVDASISEATKQTIDFGLKYLTDGTLINLVKFF